MSVKYSVSCLPSKSFLAPIQKFTMDEDGNQEREIHSFSGHYVPGCVLQTKTHKDEQDTVPSLK